MRISDYIRPVCLPATPGELKRNRLWFVTGWGATDSRRELSDTLQQVQVGSMNIVIVWGAKGNREPSDTLKPVQLRSM